VANDTLSLLRNDYSTVLDKSE